MPVVDRPLLIYRLPPDDRRTAVHAQNDIWQGNNVLYGVAAVTYVFRPVTIQRLWARDSSAAVGSQSGVQRGFQPTPAASIPPRQFDFPNPRAPWRAQQDPGFSALAINYVPTTYVFRQPTIQRNARPPSPAIRQDFTRNLGLLNPTGVQNPFSQSDWPNPRAARRSLELRTHLEVSIGGQDVFYGVSGEPPSAFNTPNPVLGRIRPISDPGQSALALGFIVLQLPFGQTDWPNPIRAARQQPQAQPRTTTLLREPFAQSDWPNPIPAVPAIGLKTWIDQTRLELIGQDAFFAAPGQGPHYDFPNPRAAGRLVAEVGPAAFPALRLSADAPFKPYDQPNPRFLPRPVYDPGSSALGLSSVVAPPFAKTDWPNPPRPSVTLTGFTASLNLAPDQVFAAPGQAPTYDWPNPRAAGRLLPDAGAAAFALLATPIIPLPFSQSDWPNPITDALRRAIRAESRGPDQYLFDFWQPTAPDPGVWTPVTPQDEVWTPDSETPVTWTEQ